MIAIDTSLQPVDLVDRTDVAGRVGREAARRLGRRWKTSDGTPVFTVRGAYTSRGWTEWTQGFQYGCAMIAGELTGDDELIAWGRDRTVDAMAPHLTHIGVHDHGFNNVSTYGTLLRLTREGRLPADRFETEFYRLALKVTGAVQASRWTNLPGDLGYVPSFNGRHSLFSDTIRSMRALAVSHRLGHRLMGEQDAVISLFRRLLQHAETTARFNVYYGEGRDRWDEAGRVVHESIFNVDSGAYRCPSTQQGYSPFSTWTRGLAWIITGYAEQLEFLLDLDEAEFAAAGLSYYPDKRSAVARFLEVARVTSEYYIRWAYADGIPVWDTGAPNFDPSGLDKAAEPYGAAEPIDASAAAIAAQGMIRLGRTLTTRGKDLAGLGVSADEATATRMTQAGLTMARTLLGSSYLSEDPEHEGILLHSVYHQPNAWDHVPEGSRVPAGESAMWGDYHLLELALLIRRMAGGGYYHFYDCLESPR